MKVRCVTCGWTGERKTDLKLNEPHPKPCPEGHEVLVGGWPPSVVETTPAGHLIEFWDKTNIETGEEQTRRYAVDGREVVGVTTVTGSTSDKSRQFVRRAIKLERQGIDWYEYTREASERGTATHDLIVRMMAEGKGGRLSELDPEHRTWGQAAASWLLDRNPELVEAERMVVGPEDYAGRFDLLCRLDGRLTLVDFKTARERPYIYRDGRVVGVYPPYPENGLQLSAYGLACEHSGYPLPARLAVVRLFPDADYDETPVEYHPDRFLAALNTYRATKAYGSELKEAMAA